MHLIESSLLSCIEYYSDNRNLAVVVAFSGGLDSSVLLHAAYQLLQQRQITALSAIHVNHGLQSLSDSWQIHCQSICDQYQIPLLSKKLNLAKLTKTSESDARDARYDFFADTLQPHQIILFAHHQDDQAETLLFRLFRGTGVHGMTGIPISRKLANGLAIRPLLDFSRQDLKKYAVQSQLQWIEDPSNQSNQYSRNFIRNDILPLIRQRWSSVSKSLTQFSSIAKHQTEILDQVAEQDLLNIEKSINSLQISNLLVLSIARQKNLIHFWIRSFAKLSPSMTVVNELLKQIEDAANKTIKIKMAGGWVRSFDGQLFYCSGDEPEVISRSIIWSDINKKLHLDNGITISATKDIQLTNNLQLLRRPQNDEVVTVRARVGGEVVTPNYREHSAELKKIYQELKVPVWQRKWLPIIYYNERLVAIPSVLIAKSMRVEREGICFALKHSKLKDI